MIIKFYEKLFPAPITSDLLYVLQQPVSTTRIPSHHI
jgi:hypothetical protein